MIVADTWSESPGRRSEQLTVLLHAYEGERTYDAETLSALTGVFATIIGILGVVGSALAFASLHPRGLPSLFAIFLPVIPFPFLGWGAICADNVIIRGQVIELYEESLRDAVRLRLAEGPNESGLPVPFGNALVGRAWWGRNTYVMCANFIVIGLMYLLILGTSAYLAWRHSPWLALIISFPCFVGFLFLMRTYLRVFQPRAFLSEAAEIRFGARVPFRTDHRADKRVSKVIGSGHKAFVPLAIVAVAIASVAFYLAYQRFRPLPPPSAETRAEVFAGRLAAVMEHRPVLTLRRIHGSSWFVKLAGPICFRINTDKFDLANMHGFALIGCKPPTASP